MGLERKYLKEGKVINLFGLLNFEESTLMTIIPTIMLFVIIIGTGFIIYHFSRINQNKSRQNEELIRKLNEIDKKINER